MTKDEQILVVPGEFVAALYVRPLFTSGPGVPEQLRAIVRDHAYVVSREWAEAHPEVKQLVAVCIVRNGNRLLAIRRSKNSNRAHMRLKYTLVVGGHVDERDLLSADDPVAACARRELAEEIGVKCLEPPCLIGCIADPATESGNLHLAILFDAQIQANAIEVRPSMDNREFTRASETLRRPLMSLPELKDIARNHAFDRWSQLFLQSRFAGDLLQSDLRVATPQLELGFA